MSLRLKCCAINQATPNAKLIFGKKLQKKYKIAKVNIIIKFCLFYLVYSGVPIKKGVGINVRGLGKLKT